MTARGSRSSGRGKVSARPQRTVTRPGRISQPAAQSLGPEDRDRDDRGARLEHQPADATLRLAERARAHARALREDADDAAALEDHPRRLHRVLVGLTTPDRERAERQQEPGLPPLVEQLDLRDEVQRPPEAAPDHERIREAAVVRGHQHRARLGHVLEADPPQPEVDVEEGLQDHAHDPVDGHHGPALTGDLVGALRDPRCSKEVPRSFTRRLQDIRRVEAAPCAAGPERRRCLFRAARRRGGEKSPPSDSNREPRPYKDRALPLS